MDKGFQLWHSYRARNGHGAVVLNKQGFFLDEKGNVTGSIDLNKNSTFSQVKIC